MIKRFAFLFILICLVSSPAFVNGQNAYNDYESAVFGQAGFKVPQQDIKIIANGKKLNFEYAPRIVNDRAMVHVRTIAEAMGCEIEWDGEFKSVLVKNDEVSAHLQINNEIMTIVKNNKITSKKLDAVPTLIFDRTFLPLRAIADIFDADVSWDFNTYTIYITYQVLAEEIVNNHTYYYQNQPEWNFEQNGSGYCWVTAYAMLLNDIVGDVTPVDVAQVNIETGENGAYCYHSAIAEKFGVKFKNALDSNSQYLKLFDPWTGATYINNEEEIDSYAIKAIKEALDLNPSGVLVRFEKSPHTLVAIGYVGDVILFNEPQPVYGNEFYNGVTFDKTYPFKCNLSISDLAYLQAITKK